MAVLGPNLLGGCAFVRYGRHRTPQPHQAHGDLVAVHLLSLPYLFACAAIGLAFSVLADRESIVQRAAMATVFGLFLLESIVMSTDYAWAGSVAPMRYFDPTAILVDGTYDVAGAVILVAATLLLVAGSQLYFRQKDVN
ncbi:hypothetical protein LPA44_09000 [Halobacterium sp. KA-4]|uniref:hypothetical protein n=1 Tax=Halobacterium sp. KA-4 TaxID=2896367 RepID=UPI001E292B08|nr:hypothetical protein [Halobacterium sp. KA-4]MCD2200033.1 hypothetical protein [Halobacterium sp. KA-4]